MNISNKNELEYIVKFLVWPFLSQCLNLEYI